MNTKVESKINLSPVSHEQLKELVDQIYHSLGDLTDGALDNLQLINATSDTEDSIKAVLENMVSRGMMTPSFLVSELEHVSADIAEEVRLASELPEDYDVVSNPELEKFSLAVQELNQLVVASDTDLKRVVELVKEVSGEIPFSKLARAAEIIKNPPATDSFHEESELLPWIRLAFLARWTVEMIFDKNEAAVNDIDLQINVSKWDAEWMNCCEGTMIINENYYDEILSELDDTCLEVLRRCRTWYGYRTYLDAMVPKRKVDEVLATITEEDETFWQKTINS